MTSLVLDWVYFYQTFKAMETVGKISKVSGLSPIIIGWSRYAVWQGLECDTQLHSTPYNRCFEQRLCLNRKPSTAREHDDFQFLSYNSDSNFSFWYAGGNFMRSVHDFFLSLTVINRNEWVWRFSWHDSCKLPLGVTFPVTTKLSRDFFSDVCRHFFSILLSRSLFFFLLFVLLFHRNVITIRRF